MPASIYLNQNPQALDLDAAMEQVCEQRRRYALRYRKKSDQRLCLAAWLLLKRALREEFGLEEEPIFRYTEQGKPLLYGHEDIHFNLSHCDEAVACAVSHHPVGIDVETYDHYSQELMTMTMSEDEQRQILGAERPNVEFTRLWTMKESLLKCTGKGISDHLPTLLAASPPYQFRTIVEARYVCTLCE